MHITIPSLLLTFWFADILVVFPGHLPVAMAHLGIAAHVLPLHHLPQQLVGESGLDIICMDGLKLKMVVYNTSGWPSLRSSNVFLPWVERSVWISHCKKSSDFLLQPVTSIYQLTAVEASAQRITREGFIGNHQEFFQIGGGPDTFACTMRRSGRCCKASMQHAKTWSVKQFLLKFARTWSIKRSQTNTQSQSDFFHLTRKTFGGTFPFSFQSLALKKARNSRTCLQASPSKWPQSWDFHRLQETTIVDLGMELWGTLVLLIKPSWHLWFSSKRGRIEEVRAGFCSVRASIRIASSWLKMFW